jgi:hypothetical protein
MVLYAWLECDPENVPILGGQSPAIDQNACSMHLWDENAKKNRSKSVKQFDVTGRFQ